MNYSAISIDDDVFACKQLKQLLTRISIPISIQGYWTNPLEAISSFPNIQPDILFLDVDMPEMDGFETLNQLRLKGFTGHVIFTTAYDDYILDALRADALDYLLKPLDLEELEKAIQHFLSRTQNTRQKDFEKLKEKGLTAREIEIAKLIFQGLSSQEIGDKLFISKGTVDKHRSNILHKTSCKNTTELFTLLS